jgi:hypothetical protein
MARAVSSWSSSTNEDPHVAAMRFNEGEGHAPTYDHLIALRQQVLQDGDLAAHLGPTNDGAYGALRVVQHLAYTGQFALHQIAEEFGGGKKAGDDGGAGVRTMCGAERIVHINVAEFAQQFAEGFVADLFFRVEPQVLQYQYFARPQRGGFGLRIRSYAIRGELYGFAEQRAKVFRHGLQAHGGVHFPLRAAEMAHEDRATAILEDLVHRAHDAPRSGIVRHIAIGILWHIEVHADQCFLTREVERVHCQHGAKIPCLQRALAGGGPDMAT